MELEKAQRMFSDVENKLKLTKLAMQQSEDTTNTDESLCPRT